MGAKHSHGIDCRCPEDCENRRENIRRSNSMRCGTCTRINCPVHWTWNEAGRIVQIAT